MNPADLDIFITAADEFLKILGGERPEIGESHIDFGDLPLLDYTSMISVSGASDGAVYFTAAEAPLKKMLESLEEDENSDNLKRDLLGELTGTVVMNARERFGQGLQVAVPEVFGPGDAPPLADRIGFVTPMLWGGGKIDMIIAVNFENS